MKKVVIVLVNISTLFLYSQPGIIWDRTFGENSWNIGFSIQETSDGGFIIGGSTIPFRNGNNDFLLIKTDSQGNEIWTNTFGDTTEDLGRYAIQTRDGGYVFTGFTVKNDQSDILIIKTYGNGHEEWRKTHDNNNGNDYSYSVIQTRDGGYAIIGASDGGNFFTSVFLLKTDSLGNEEWSKTYGGIDADYGRSIQQTSDGGYIIGYIDGNIYTGIALKVDSRGNEEWNARLSIEGASASAVNSVRQTNDGGYILTGNVFFSKSGHTDLIIQKLDFVGREEWHVVYGGDEMDEGFSIIQSSTNGFLLTGKTRTSGNGENDLWIIKTDRRGNEIYNYTYGGKRSDAGYDIIQARDGNVIIVGSTMARGNGTTDVWLIKHEFE